MTRIRLDLIAFDAGTQIREAINEQVVAEYAERMSEGVEFPPVVLFHDGTRYFMADGFHRYMGAKRNAFADIAAVVQAGTREDALWFALGANKANGHRMTERDKRHALMLGFNAWPDRSARQMAEQVGCSSTYASRIRDEVQTSLHLVARVVGSDGVSYPASKEARIATRNEAERLLREGRSVEDVRAVTGIGRDAAKQIQRELGGVLDKSRSAVQERRERMRAMAADGYSSVQIAGSLGISVEGCRATLRKEGIEVPADAVVRNTKQLHDANRIVERIVMDAENLVEGVNLIEFSDLDRDRLADWLKSLSRSRDQLGGFIRRLMKEQQHGEAA